MSEGRKIIVIAFLIFVICPFYAHEAKGELSKESQACLVCHSNRQLTKQLESKEILSLYVDRNEFTTSIHNATGCAGCHLDISMETHLKKKRKITSRKDYVENISKVCMICHPDEMLKTKPMHGKLITQAKVPSCAECHGSHYIKKMAEWRADVTKHQYCLTCHAHDVAMSLKSGEVLHLSIDTSAFKSSVHGSLSCSVCHRGFSKSEHPVRTFKSKKEYTASASQACSMCHTEERLSKKPTHRTLMARATCVECHGSHAIMGVFAQRTRLTETQYCLSCHTLDLSMRLKNAESLTLSVNGSVLRSSVHGNLQCHDCHVGFSSTRHPSKIYNSRREYSVVVGDVCTKCHEEVDKEYKNSIHYAIFKKGYIWAPLCTDCHGFHSTAKATTDKTLGLVSCNKCHKDINAIYESSIHSIARMRGREDAAVCSSCHEAHDVRVTAMTMRIKERCLICHKDIEDAHKRWLNNPPFKLSSFAELHFDTVTCAACHVTDAKRGIYLILSDRKTGEPLLEQEVLGIFETDTSGLRGKFDTNGDNSVDASEVWDIFKQSYKKDVAITFMGRMDIKEGTEAHQLADKSEAVRECERCHRADSEFFKDVFIAICKDDEMPVLLRAQQEVLGNVFAIVPVSKFYALGSTNVKLLDILFIVALIGGIAVPIGHISFRIITSPIRSLRKMGKGGKK